MWTRFYDMHSGGRSKLDWEIIYIEAPKEKAIKIFKEKFDRDPFNITCDCCGDDYDVDSEETLEAVTKFFRGKNISLDNYLKDQTVHFIFADKLV